MSEDLNIIRPSIFAKYEVISGITEKMQDLFPNNGFSVSENESITADEVFTNKSKLASFLNSNYRNFIFQKQTHSDIVRIIDKNFEESISDGMITKSFGIYLCIKIADCCAVLCYDPKSKAIGAFHCGWRGAYNGILSKGIKMMSDEFSSNPSDILFYLSPCASKCCYEVGPEFCMYFPESVTKVRGKYYFDLKAELKNQLLAIGCNAANIEISQFCTICDERFHSYRRDKDNSGRMVAFIGMR